MLIIDWSSDVCSSDLERAAGIGFRRAAAAGVGLAEPHFRRANARHLADTIERLGRGKPAETDTLLLGVGDFALRAGHVRPVAPGAVFDQIGRASCRERGCTYLSISSVAVSLINNNYRTHKDN